MPSRLKRIAYLFAGGISLLIGACGLVLPILPTVPFVLLAAFCFARSSPRIEQKLVQHRTFGRHIEAWRTNGAISGSGKRAACVAFTVSAVLAIALLEGPASLMPVVIAIVGIGWIVSRPSPVE